MKGVLVGLILASLWSWAVILDKLVRFGRATRAAEDFEARVNSGRPLEDVAAEVGEDPVDPLPRMLQAALREWRANRTLKGGLTDTQTSLAIGRIDKALDSVIAREGRKVEEGLGVLAIVATASPTRRGSSMSK